MRAALVFGFSFFVALAFGQNADSLAAAAQVDSLIKVSRELTAKKNFEKALEVNAEAEKIALERFGRESAAYGGCCFNRGRVLFFEGEYAEAEKWYFESITIREKVIGKVHPDYARSLSNLAGLYEQAGYYDKAEPLLLEAIAILEKTFGKEHRSYYSELSALGTLYSKMGIYEKAEPIQIEVKTIVAKVLGKEHINYAGILINLAITYKDMGNYDKAGQGFLEAKEIAEANKEHPFYMVYLYGISDMYKDLGNHEKAEPLMREAITIAEKSKGKESINYAGMLGNLALLYKETGQYEKAEPLFLEALAILEKIFGKEHPYSVQVQHNLASLYNNMGNDALAENMLVQIKSIYEKFPGKKPDIYAQCLNSLGLLYKAKSKFEKAEPLFLEAKDIFRESEGLGTSYMAAVSNLASLYETIGRFSESEPLLAELSEFEQTRLSKSVSFLSESDLAQYAATFRRSLNDLGSYILKHPSSKDGIQSGGLAPLIFNHTLLHKGFLLNAACRLNALSTTSPESEEISHRLKGYRRRIAAEYAKPIAERKDVADLEEKANTLEKDLVRTVAGYGAATRQVNWQEVQATLKKGEVAIEFVHFRYWDKKSTDSTMYTALLLMPGTAQPVFIPLFEEKSLDSLLHTRAERKADYVNGLYTLAERGAKPLGKPQKTLYDLLWKPLEPHLSPSFGGQGGPTVYFSPSGLLHRLNLGAIPIGLDSVLADRYRLVELGSTRQLVVPTTVKPAANDAVLFGSIAYEADSTAISEINAGLDSVSIASRGELSFAYTDSTLRVGTWSALPFTDREVGSVEKTLKTAGFQSDTRRGFAATEEAFKTLGAGGRPSPRVLHIATHGFFFPDPEKTSARFETSPTFAAAEPVFKISDHPMIRSGLLLAGGNHAWATGKPLRPGMEDGILTAYEISQMNLANTELVVLSACETGLGDISGNEGVYGLQRAFKIAGAKYLIMSLWQVPDKQTSLLMTTFYKKWLEEKMAIPEAFRAAQKELREAGLDPYQWAGFVLVE